MVANKPPPTCVCVCKFWLVALYCQIGRILAGGTRWVGYSHYLVSDAFFLDLLGISQLRCSQ